MNESYIIRVPGEVARRITAAAGTPKSRATRTFKKDSQYELKMDKNAFYRAALNLRLDGDPAYKYLSGMAKADMMVDALYTRNGYCIR